MKTYQIPKTKDPFVNTFLLDAGIDPATGEQRYWFSTYNAFSGTTGVLLTETGKYRKYAFDRHTPSASCPVPAKFPGFYNAVMEDGDTLWLVGTVDFAVRLSLSSGEYEVFPTGLIKYLSFGGIAFDATAKKLLLMAHSYCGNNRLEAASFDTANRRIVRNYSFDKPGFGTNRWRFANGDGRHTICVGSLK